MAKRPPSQQPTKDAIDSSIDRLFEVNTEAPKTINPQSLSKARDNAPDQQHYSSPQQPTYPPASFATYNLSKAAQQPRVWYEEAPLSPRSRPHPKDDLATSTAAQDPYPLHLPPHPLPPCPQEDAQLSWDDILAKSRTPETMAVLYRFLPFFKVLHEDQLYGHRRAEPWERRGGFSGGSEACGEGDNDKDKTHDEDGRTAGEGEDGRASRKRSHDGSLDAGSEGRAKRRGLGT